MDGTHLEYHATRGTVAAHAGLRIPLEGSGAGFCARTGSPYLMVDAGTDPHVKRDLVGTLQIGSAVFAPVLRGATVLGVLKLQSRVPVAF
ncbi:GAF domain-containing protein, partial [Staphylococcus epidermidis]|nr:GAF domain-containing protein [Staphylococcus epidermidis]